MLELQVELAEKSWLVVNYWWVIYLPVKLAEVGVSGYRYASVFAWCQLATKTELVLSKQAMMLAQAALVAG